jgi:hypothetical protein
MTAESELPTRINGVITGIRPRDGAKINLEGVPVYLFHYDSKTREFEYTNMKLSSKTGKFEFDDLDAKGEYSIQATNPVDIDGDGFPEWAIAERSEPLIERPSDKSHEFYYVQIFDPKRVASVNKNLDRVSNSVQEVATSLQGVSGNVQDIAAYPILTGGAGLQASPSTPSAAGGAAPLGQVVETTLRTVLGWRPRADDPKGFAAALTQSFSPREHEGHTDWVWTPRSYAVQADMGAVTGAQASIYARAQNALDQAMPLLEGLYPLDPAADPQDVEAQRAIVRSDLTELVSELGIQGGPRVQRVDSLFGSLLGLGPDQRLDDPEEVQGHLHDLISTFGLTRGQVNTVDEEQDLTNIVILVDHVNALKQSWDAQRGFFDGTAAEPYLGTQLVLLSRALAVVAESKQEADFAMDSVFVGSAERQTIRLDFGGKVIQVPQNGTFVPFTFPARTALFVGELLEWVDRFASIEGPRLINDGGKAGVRAAAPTLDNLRRLVRGALISPQDANTLPAGYRTARVQRALQELADNLDEAATLANRF